eukprot:CAMPEP_0175968122 /NCGR_PEP_ID=MMETSP0108-20121206/39708_1 /TAXON_ID=195067 ORGANISM="Goniomonas pacifica, Strain CCMP1869" /NCGR_SAMPLE_ID=MMETSP0108 /ASSEMBLY_ACC=CAM_ASM_000204 /LENGTH=163 /DNA_ID=CAMNT_0017296713 /DNA_START=263 /DNA_END=750 /DNA_ORIENTATION=+
MTRAKETAAIINEELAKSRGSKLHITYLECIRECRPAVPDPLGSRSLATYQKDVQKCAPKMDEAFKTLLFRPPEDQTQDSVVIVVGHANVFRWLTLRVNSSNFCTGVAARTRGVVADVVGELQPYVVGAPTLRSRDPQSIRGLRTPQTRGNKLLLSIFHVFSS